MTARVLNGKELAEQVRAAVKADVVDFEKAFGRAPGLDVIIVGEDPASVVYTRNKEKAALEVGMRGNLHRLPEQSSEAELLAMIDRLNGDATVDGILVQLPLPKHIDSEKVILAIDPGKDVDGFHPVNAGQLAIGRADRALVPCTPRGCMKLLALSGVSLAGARAVVVGRSNIVGKPVAQLLLAEHATVTIAHSRTRDLPAVCREADVLVAAVGKPEMVRGDWVKQGAVVIDVGINRVQDASNPGKTKLVGDVAYAEAAERAGAITPVPGGVGPLTIACLLENTLVSAKRRSALG
jgi:methylenetetrahydrofolate dehydrogenase (NADP+)/methenyltetrahydrofolate cyclohydrolase